MSIRIVVDAHPAEIRTESKLHFSAKGIRQGVPAAEQRTDRLIAGTRLQPRQGICIN